MPIPSREKNEDKDLFVSRCIKSIIDEYGQEQAAAICYKASEEKMSFQKIVCDECRWSWDLKDGGKDPYVCHRCGNKMPEPVAEEVFVLTPKKTENRGKYLQRCSAHPKMKEQFKDMKDRMGQCLNAFNEYYKWWVKMEEFGEKDVEGTILGDCITKKRAQGLDYKSAYARCASKVVAPSGPIVLSEDELIIEPVAMDDFADTFNDYPESVKNAAKRAVDYAEENGWGSCGTAVGKQRASQLAKGENISVDTIKRMYSYLSRHKVDLQSSKSYDEGCGKLMYDAWGGESALGWSERKLKQLEKK
jgi:hypothetical protein